MLKKGFKQMLAEANAVVESVSVQDAVPLLDDAQVVFLDVREAAERQNGFIPGSVHAPRGFLEFVVDPEGPMHNPTLAGDKTLVVYCGSGGRSALACRTLHEMGFKRVCNLVGGFSAWSAAGAPSQR
jgi:rhodanese-related sulfurtransferase